MINQGSRVFHRTRPEFGFGVVKLMDETPFGEVRCNVAFDYVDGIVPALPDDLVEALDPVSAFQSGQFGDVTTFRRRLSAALLISENNRTGVFMRVAVEPMPHQAFLLDKVLSGGRYGHMLADDVGLGKTVEAGLLITSLLQENPTAKILVICPAGVALQWQDDLKEHFSLEFAVLGRQQDFSGQTSASWHGKNQVIAPIDRIKKEESRSVLREVGPFDLVICDEAHRLTARREFFSNDLRTTVSYRLVRWLVDEQVVRFALGADGAPRSPFLLLLSATPHQGDHLRFAYLMKLVRPDVFTGDGDDLVATLTPENLRESLTRTAKHRAVNWDGRPLFHGHETETRQISWTPAEHACSTMLTQYIREGMAASLQLARGRALVIELAMHTFHKLAASSWVALEAALRRRLANLEGRAQALEENWEDGDEENSELDGPELFREELNLLEGMLRQLRALPGDSKWNHCAELLGRLEAREPGLKVLFFTQYRVTQDWLAECLAGAFPGAGVEVINGSLALEERRDARVRFETSSRFLVSTEAGGEGINMQRNCHVMVNYDLPWNAMRLQQRIGRLDRYGQRRRVQVFNLQVRDSWDNRISTRILERIVAVQEALGPVTDGTENYREMIMGVVVDELDTAYLFREWLEHGQDVLSDAQLDEMIRRASEGVRQWRSLLSGDLGLDPAALPAPSSLGGRELMQTFELLLEQQGQRLRETRTSENQHVPGVWHFEVPPGFRSPALIAARQRYVTFDRERFLAVRGESLGRVRGQDIRASLIGFGDPFTNWIFEQGVQAESNTGAYAVGINSEHWLRGPGYVAVAVLRWRASPNKLRAADTLVALFCADNNSGAWIELSPQETATLALQSTASVMDDSTPPNLQGARQMVIDTLRQLVDRQRAPRQNVGWSWWVLARVMILASA